MLLLHLVVYCFFLDEFSKEVHKGKCLLKLLLDSLIPQSFKQTRPHLYPHINRTTARHLYPQLSHAVNIAMCRASVTRLSRHSTAIALLLASTVTTWPLLFSLRSIVWRMRLGWCVKVRDGSGVQWWARHGGRGEDESVWIFEASRESDNCFRIYFLNAPVLLLLVLKKKKNLKLQNMHQLNEGGRVRFNHGEIKGDELKSWNFNWRVFWSTICKGVVLVWAIYTNDHWTFTKCAILSVNF